MNPLDVAVIGGSLGGLTAACLLRDSGHRVTIYERSATPLEERGAGIGFLPATYRYLVERAGLDLSTVSVSTDLIRYLDRDGTVATELAHRYLFSSWNTVYRALFNQWNSRPDGPARYVLGHEMVDFTRTIHGGDRPWFFAPSTDASSAGGVHGSGESAVGDAPNRTSLPGVALSFANGSTAHCDLLVCADGVGSMARATLQPQAAAAYAGYVAWRGMVPEAALRPETAKELGEAITYFVYANSHILVYPIPAVDGGVAPGQRLINFVWYRNYNEGTDLDDLMTDVTGVLRPLSLPPGTVPAHHVAELRAVAQARLPPQLAEVVAATDEPFVQVIYDIEVEQMAFDHICLLGDAAFAVRPHAAAGTAKACDDGWRLAAELDAHTELGSALAAWESSQLALGRRLLARTRAIGRQSQVDNNWQPEDPDHLFGLEQAGAPS